MQGHRTLPLFPVSTVLFPGAVLPLRVFEDRYKQMIHTCLEADRALGIVLIRSGWEVGPGAIPHDVGTLARIVRTDMLNGGRINVAVVGEQRFRIRSILDDKPYIQGNVELLSDEPPTASESRASELEQAFGEYARILHHLSQRKRGTVQLPTNPLELSYTVAANLQINRTEQQALLEESATRRIAHEHEILRREIVMLEKLGAVTTRRVRTAADVSLN